jgi:hypothetical protein
VDDPRIKKLRLMVQQAIQMHDASEQLIAELNEQLHRHDPPADTRGAPRIDRRQKSRT